LFSSQTSALHCTSSSEGQSGFENQHPDSCAGFLKRIEGEKEKRRKSRKEKEGEREGGREENILSS
jgi:hypothetical protein